MAKRFVGAVLPDYNIILNKPSQKNKSGKANIIPKEGKNVYGIVYEIDEKDVETLKEYERG
ncbi:MAG: gamma-glutamylcyclotransferase [Bacteroidetes bacterium]|nr:gamma-glutamylcyclotransferase [Bacteroidota bacterium]